MSKQLSLTLTILLLSAVTFAADDYQTWWKKGNQYYQQKEYDSAAHYYSQIATASPANAEVYYNLGNAYYRLNNIGHAVLNYERALHLKPSYKEAADNLYLTQSRINNRIPHIPEIFFVKWWKSISQPGLANIYAILAILFFLLVMGYHITKRLNVIRMNMPIQLTVALLVVSGLLVLLSTIAGNKMVNSGKAVIMQEGTPMAPEPKYGTSQILVPEGTTVEVHSNKGDWQEITLPDGRTGWVQQSAIIKI